MKFFEAEIEDPREIRDARDKSFEKAKKHGKIALGLDHSHYSVIRGRSERKTGLEDKIDLDLGYPVELVRDDGGNSWVHSPESRCFMKAVVDSSLDSKNNEELMRRWGEEISREVEDFTGKADYDGAEIDAFYSGGDVYDTNTGSQVAGLSGEFRDGAALFRMCTYQGRDHGKPFHELAGADIEEGLEDFRHHYIPLGGFYEHLMDEPSEELEVEKYTGPRPEGHREPTYCIGSHQLKK